MLQSQLQVRRHAKNSLSVALAKSAQEVFEAQRLRFKVFAEEMGTRVNGHEQGIDRDLYDAHCEHLAGA